MHNHQHAQRLPSGARLERGNQPATGQVGGRSLGDQHFGINGQDLVHVQAVLDDDFVALAGQRLVDGVAGFGGKAEQEKFHRQESIISPVGNYWMRKPEGFDTRKERTTRMRTGP